MGPPQLTPSPPPHACQVHAQFGISVERLDAAAHDDDDEPVAVEA